MKEIILTPSQKLRVDETGTIFIEDEHFSNPLQCYLPDLIAFLRDVNNEHNPNKEDRI